ncbi:MAG: heme exporter protein CcmD [Hyphomonadaceae bacterium]
MQLIPPFDDSAGYIWAAYGLALALIGGALLVTALRNRAAKRRLSRLEKSDER